jgi:hypothetical protein
MNFSEMDSKERKEKLQEKLTELSSQLILNPKKIKELSQRWQAGFHRYSWNNLILIWLQKPSATLCAGFKTWRTHKRYVRKGEHAIWILGPYIKTGEFKTRNPITGQTTMEEDTRIVGYFPVATFDVSQTDGEPLDIGANKAKFVSGALTLQELSAKFPEYPMTIVERREDGRARENIIEVSSRSNPAQMAFTYLHELAHIMLGHTNKERISKVTHDVAELEAEATAYVVGSCFGIESEDAVHYIMSWNGNKEKLANSAFAVFKTADKILRRFTKKKEEEESE